jgi:hypothetical protein
MPPPVRSHVRLFNLSLVEKALGLAIAIRSAGHASLDRATCNFSRQSRVQFQQEWQFVGDRNVDVGNQTTARKPAQPGPRRSAAMAQQCGDSGRGHQSVPQKLLQLVGCREFKVRPQPGLRPPVQG